MDSKAYYDIITRIKNCMVYYQKQDYKYTKYYLELANGNKLILKFDPNNIPHLLGINIDTLRNTNQYTGNAYNIACTIINNPQELYNQIENGHIASENVFSEYIDRKLNNFKNIWDINIQNIEFIVKYEQNKNIRNNLPLYNGYYIGYVAGPNLGIIGFEKNEQNNTFYPHTNLLFKQYTEESDNFLKRLCSNQIITVVDIMRKYTIKDDGTIDKKILFYKNYEKLHKLNNCKRYAETYNAAVDTIQSNIFYVEKVINLNDEKRNIYEILNEISNNIKDKQIIDLYELKEKYNNIDNSIIEMINAHNTLLTSNIETDAIYLYTEILKKYAQCKNRVLALNNLINQTNENITKITQENLKLKQENQELNEERNQIKRILIK